VTDVPRYIDLEDHMDFGEEARRQEWRTAIKRVADQAREKEAAFYKEHGMSSAEYFHESGYSDADAERAAEEAAQEDEDEYGEAQAALEEEL
jgi:translation initiation factor 2 alpha subunit (eIF-2alpha)